MTILRGECGYIKLRWDNHDRCIKCSSCSRNQPALRVAPGQIKPGNLPKKEELRF